MQGHRKRLTNEKAKNRPIRYLEMGAFSARFARYRKFNGLFINNCAMSSAMDVEVPARYFFSDAVDFYHDFHGECEDCGRIVPEWSLIQCQYGFCGKFCCPKCGFRCRKCGDHEPRSVSLCSSHAAMVYPRCDGCKKQFCDICSKILVNQVCLFLCFLW